MQYTSGTDMASWTPGRSSPSTGRDRALNVESGSTVESQRSQVLEFAMAEGDSKITIFLRRLLLALLIFFLFVVFLTFPRPSQLGIVSGPPH